MRMYRVTMTWSDDETTTTWVEAKNEQHAAFLAGNQFSEYAMELIRDVYAVLETN